MTLAHTHDVHQVFDPNYVPRTQEERELFSEKQKFAMSVLVHSIKTDVGITIVWKHYKARPKNAGRRSEMRLPSQLELTLSSCPCQSSLLRLTPTGMVIWKVFPHYWSSLITKIEEIFLSNSIIPGR